MMCFFASCGSKWTRPSPSLLSAILRSHFDFLTMVFYTSSFPQPSNCVSNSQYPCFAKWEFFFCPRVSLLLCFLCRKFRRILITIFVRLCHPHFSAPLAQITPGQVRDSTPIEHKEIANALALKSSSLYDSAEVRAASGSVDKTKKNSLNTCMLVFSSTLF